MAYVGTPIDTQNQFQSLQGKRFSGDASTTAFTLDITPSSVFDIEVFVENVRQDPNSAYSLSGTTLTFTGAPPSGTNNIYVVHQAKAVGTINPPDASVNSDKLTGNLVTPGTLDVNGQELILDADADTSITADTDDQIDFKTGGTDRVIIDSSGNVGIGTSSPDYKFEIETADNAIANFKSTDANANIRFTDSDSTANGYAGVGAIGDTLTLIAGNDNRMLILSNGDVFFSSTTETAIGGGSTDGKMIDNADGARLRSSRASTSSREHLVFYNPNGGVGSITTNGSSTSYNTSSDYRLKENVVNITSATERLKQLSPKRFNFIADVDTTVDGFLAHEVSSIVPEAITGTHNEVQVWEEGEELPDGVSVGDNKLDDEGNTIPVYQGIDQSKLVPLLVATIKELEARITALEG
jgi:hypothetical protein